VFEKPYGQLYARFPVLLRRAEPIKLSGGQKFEEEVTLIDGLRLVGQSDSDALRFYPNVSEFLQVSP
jgi:hypothetical protein